MEPYLRSYIEICISICYFRVPSFQNIFLDCVKERLDKLDTFEEWRNINWSLEDDPTSNDFKFGLL